MGWGNRWKVSRKIQESSQKKTVCKGNFLKRRLGQFTDLRGSLRSSPYYHQGATGFLFLSSLSYRQDHIYIVNICSTLPRKYVVPTSCLYLSLKVELTSLPSTSLKFSQKQFF